MKSKTYVEESVDAEEDKMSEGKELDELPTDANFWVYQAWVDYINTPDLESPIFQSYLDVILDGCLEVGKEFAEEFLLTTYNWGVWVNDRKNQRYPRALEKSQNVELIEELFKTYIPEQVKNRIEID